MKSNFFVARASSKTFKVFCLYSVQSPFAWRTPYFYGQPTIRIDANFQNKLPLLRPLAVMDTMSWSPGSPHRKSCTSLQRSWSQKAAVDLNTFLRPHLRNWCWKPVQWNVIIIIIIIIIIMIVVVGVVDDDSGALARETRLRSTMGK